MTINLKFYEKYLLTAGYYLYAISIK